jgi:diguanylate cyclase (GGDEF)-like protein/PAS domain S-box-containing protein
MNDKERIQRLEEQILYLSQEKSLTVHFLEIAASLGGFQSSLNKLEDPQPILVETVDKVRNVALFDAAGVYLVDESDGDLVLAYCDPPDSAPRLEAELRFLIQDNILAWAMGRREQVVVSSQDKQRSLLLHSMSTASRVRGLFLGELGQDRQEIRDISYALLSIIFLSCANLLESFELYRRIKDINAALQDNLAKLERSEKRLREHRDELEHEVAERTKELREINERLLAEIKVREASDKALGRERDFSDAVLQTAAALVLVLDPSGRIERFNQACERVSGYSSEEAVGAFVWDLVVAPEGRESIQEYFLGLTPESFPSARENVWVSKTGARRFISWSNAGLADSQGKIRHVIATGVDITEKRSAERALRDSEMRFRAIFMKAGIGVALRDVQGQYLDGNPSLCRMLGYQAKELLAMNMRGVIHPDDLPASLEAEQRLIDGEREACVMEKRLLRKDGSIVFARTTVTLIRDVRRTPQYFLSMIQDVTESRRMEQALREAEDAYRALFENAVEGVFMARPDGVLTNVNQAMAHILGYSAPDKLLAAAKESGPELYVNPDAWLAFLECVRRAPVSNYEMRLVRKDGRQIWASISARASQAPHGDAARIEGLVEDITDRKISEFQLQRKATFDSLTNIPNRYLLHDRFEQMLAQAKRHGHTVTVLFIDLDGFKTINDEHGHHVGDLLLAEVAARLRTRVRRSDTLARLGGDEFTILLYDAPSKGNVARVAEQVIATISQSYYPENLKCTIGASIGISMFPYDGDEPHELLRKADAAMYKAKERGGRCAVFYEELRGPSPDPAPPSGTEEKGRDPKTTAKTPGP